MASRHGVAAPATSWISIRSVLSLAVAALLVAPACNGIPRRAAASGLAPDQTLRFPVQQDVHSLDPGHVLTFEDTTFAQELFSGLYRFDDNLKIVPDIARGMPDVSPDGMTYTFHLRHDAKFSNGDPVKSADVLYSWNRVAYLGDGYASMFDPVAGGPDTEARKTRAMSGLSAPDAYTIRATLTAPAGYWLTEIALATASVVDQRVIEQTDGTDLDKQTTWWTRPETAVGTGPFRMVERTAKLSMGFAPVPGWYGGSTGALTSVKVDIGVDQATMVKKYEAGLYDLVGPGSNSLGPGDLLRYRNDPAKRAELHIYPAARTNWIGFNEVTGPFQGRVAGHDGRQAFSTAIDRDQLVELGCAAGTTCQKATGGVIAKGIGGYLGDNKDTNAVFDRDLAKSLYSRWDPTGSKVAGLQYRYFNTAANTEVANILQSQWQANLGVKVELAPSDFATMIKDGNAKKAIMFRGQWAADYDHPSDWFDILFTCAQAAPGNSGWEGYCNPAMDKIVHQADGEPLDRAIPLYQQAGAMMVTDAVDATIVYGTVSYVTKPYVRGAGYNGLYDFPWAGISLAKH